jgi:signal transduction histidine kinase/DNA-binding response OmpR family regulator
MTANSIIESFLAGQGYALFEYLGGGEFVAIGDCPSWCEEIWGAEVRNAKHVKLAENSAFLENFLVDAEESWRSGGTGSAGSGTWIERGVSGREIPLEAFALALDGKNILILRNLSSTFAEQQRWFQTARDSLLAHEKLLTEIQKKEILLHCIIHDLSQPLSAMSGCFNLLLLERLPPALKKFARDGLRESQRQESMIRGILSAFSGDLEAQQSAGGSGAPAPNLAACAQKALEEFSAASVEKEIQLRLDPRVNPSLDWRVVGDAARLDRVFGNLLENALRHSPKGTMVTIGLEHDGSFVLAFVDDEGPGLPKDQPAGGLFALFAKGKNHSGKAGLGLYFCKITVERWGGTIGAETRSGGGSRFWFRLPRAAKESEGHAEKANVEKTAAPAEAFYKAAPSRPLRVLIAEDTEINRELLTELLERRGHSTSSANDGLQALAALERERFDAVLMDEEMPRMNGLDATRVIRQKEISTGEHIIVIGLTGNATMEDERKGLEAGMDAFLGKPIQMDKLYRTLESLARGLTPVAGLHAPSEAPPSSQTVSDLSGSDSEGVAAHLRRTTGHNKKLQQSLIRTFLADAPKTLLLIRRAVDRKNAEKLATAAHALKGSLAIFGASNAVAAAHKLQTMGRDRDLHEAQSEFRVLEAEFVRLQRELMSLRAKPKRSTKPKSKHRRKR